METKKESKRAEEKENRDGRERKFKKEMKRIIHKNNRISPGDRISEKPKRERERVGGG